jgi:NADH dehydrogenase
MEHRAASPPSKVSCFAPATLAMILLTGATGVIGSALLPRLLQDGEAVRCLVRDPRRLGANRVRVQITLGDLADPVALRQAVRGVRAVVHLAAAIRDQRDATIEELNGLATARLLRYARSANVERFVYFGAMGATPSSRTRFFRAKALAERAVAAAPIDTTVLSPSIVYDPSDPFMSLLRRLSLLPVMPISGTGRARYQPIWAQDAAECALHALRDGSPNDDRRLELAGPEVLSYEDIVRLALDAWDRPRPLLHVPLWAVRRGLGVIERLAGTSAFATWEEAELMEVPMTTPRGVEDVRRLGVTPKAMEQVLGLAGG